MGSLILEGRHRSLVFGCCAQKSYEWRRLEILIIVKCLTLFHTLISFRSALVGSYWRDPLDWYTRFNFNSVVCRPVNTLNIKIMHRSLATSSTISLHIFLNTHCLVVLRSKLAMTNESAGCFPRIHDGDLWCGSGLSWVSAHYVLRMDRFRELAHHLDVVNCFSLLGYIFQRLRYWNRCFARWWGCSGLWWRGLWGGYRCFNEAGLF